MWKPTRDFVTEGTQLESQVADTSLVTSYILSGDEHENRDAVPIKNRPCDWPKRSLNFLRLNTNKNINLDILFLIYPCHSFPDNLQSLQCLNVPQMVTTGLELHRTKCQGSIKCIPGVSTHPTQSLAEYAYSFLQHFFFFCFVISKQLLHPPLILSPVFTSLCLTPFTILHHF
jgi:hypothetical protein